MRFIAPIVLLIYGVALIAGGAAGYSQAGSMVSLVAGSASGIVAILAFGLSFKRPVAGLILGAVVSVTVGAMMLQRWLGSGKFMPAGMTTILSAVTLVVMGFGLTSAISRRRRRR